MSPTVKVILELAEQVKIENSKNKDKIPSSDTFIRKMSTYFSRTDDEILKYFNDLKECHYIFIINVVQGDGKIKSVDAYVFADIGILTSLKEFADKNLESLYEGMFYKRKSASMIIRELFTKVKEYNNTPLGRAINEAVMTEEYHRLITSNPYEFTDAWRKEKLFKIYDDEEEEGVNEKPTPRAVDQIKKDVASVNPNSKWGKAINQFSVEFLVRIHFRKYEFEVIKKLVLNGKINSEVDLKYIRDTLKLMETRTEVDTVLKRYVNEMVELRRLVQGKLNILKGSNH
ncbi:MAG: hypothetical protein L6Q54_07650 [Leptospiraceae bacterium]|nr:hypothetical protein [Leptospiraceae bacterium]MCK6381109.1 hypothetical protein [Leptospiraceae bacterium]NUM41944.1 hypothetical protein [Leptospiraceae bacterium]